MEAKEASQLTSVQKMNLYAVFGTALLVTIITLLSFVAGAFLLSMVFNKGHYYGWGDSLMPVVLIFYILAILAITVFVPILRLARRGWRTVISTLLVEFVMLFVASLIAAWVVTLVSSSSCNSYSSGDDFNSRITMGANAANIDQQYCY